MADVVKDKTVYLLKFVSALSHRHFLQCASYMLATGLQKGVIWNIYDNKLYNVEIPDRDAFLNAVVKSLRRAYTIRFTNSFWKRITRKTLIRFSTKS